MSFSCKQELTPGLAPLRISADNSDMLNLDALRKENTEIEILDSKEATRKYSANTSGENREILGAAFCRTTEQVQAVLKWSSEFKVPVSVVSTGKNWGYGCALPVAEKSFILDLSQMKKIREFNPQLGYVNLEPGVTQQDLADFLDAQSSSFMVPVTGAGPLVSILANALERGYGITPITDHFQAILSMEVVLPNGTIYQSYVREIRKNKTELGHKWGLGPYLDGLFCQSSFGVVTSMTIALARRPEICGSLLFEPKENRQISELIPVIQELLRDFPGLIGGINLMNQHRVLAMVSQFPVAEVDGNGLLTSDGLTRLARQHQIKAWTGFGTIYGSKPIAKALLKEVRKRLRPYCSRILFFTPSQTDRLLQIVRWIPFFPASLLSKLQAVQRSLSLVKGRPNETALPLTLWKYPVAHVPGEPIDPASNGAGLLWYSPLVAMNQEEVEEYISWTRETLIQFGREPLITLTTLSERCFDSTVPILFNRQSPEDTRMAHACLNHLLEEGAKKGFIPYRLGISTMAWIEKQNLSSFHLSNRIRNGLFENSELLTGRYQ